jgi:pimeloyl-ACP methyl ester carboxylesterase
MGWSVWDRLSSISVPTRLVSSSHDYTPVSEKNRIVAEMPRADLSVIGDARHALPVEKPAAFNATVEEFLTCIEKDS